VEQSQAGLFIVARVFQNFHLSRIMPILVNQQIRVQKTRKVLESTCKISETRRIITTRNSARRAKNGGIDIKICKYRLISMLQEKQQSREVKEYSINILLSAVKLLIVKCEVAMPRNDIKKKIIFNKKNYAGVTKIDM